MRTRNDTITSARSQRLASAWALGVLGAASADYRRMISPWAYRHLNGIAAVHFAVGVLLGGFSVALIAHGFHGWAALPLAGVAVHFAIGWADITIARSVPSRA